MNIIHRIIKSFGYPTLEIEALSKNEILDYLLDKKIDEFSEPHEYYFNYYLYENIPKIDVYIADVWYGYFNKNYLHNESEITITKENIIKEKYPQISEDSRRCEYLNINISAIKEELNDLLERYFMSEEFENEVTEKYNNDTKVDKDTAKNILKEKYENEEEIAKENLEDYIKNEISSSYCDEQGKFILDKFKEDKNITDEEWLKYRIETIKTDMFNRVTKMTHSENINYYTRRVGVEKTYNGLNNYKETWTYNEIAAENFHFTKLLQQSKNAYSTLRNMREWFLESLKNTVSSNSVIEKVQHLLDQAYSSQLLNNITDEDLLKLYNTTSSKLYISSNAKFTETAKACHDYLRLNNYYYSSAANKAAGNYVQDGTSTGRYVPIVLGEPQNERYIDCSAYVTWVLQQTGNLGSETIWQWTSTKLFTQADGGIDGVKEKSFTSKADMMQFFETVDTTQYGYILVKKGHTEIFAGIQDGYYCTYNAGSTSAIRKEKSQYSKEGFFNHFSSSEYKVLIVGGSENNG